MKKFLTSAIAAALVATTVGAFVACGDKDEGGKKNNDAELAQKGLATVIDLTSRIAEETPASYTVLGQTSAGGKMYDVKWSVTSEFPSYETYVSVGEKDPDTKKVTINITKATEVVEYTLKATVTVGKASKSEEFKHKIPAGQAQEGQTDVSISFAGQATSGARTEFTADKQVWTQNGITLTNNKGASTTAVNNATSEYHVRLYKSSSVKIEYPGMTKLIFHSDSKQGTSDYHAYLKSTLEATGLGTVTADAENLTVTLELASPMNEIEFVATGGQIRLTALDVVANKTPATDADKVNGAKAALDLDVKSYAATGTYNLPAEKLGATVTWALKAGTTSNYVSINNDGKLVISSMPQEETEVKLTATLTVNDETATKDFTITLVPLGLENDGTEAHPYTAAEAWRVANLLSTTSADEVFVKGFVVLPGAYNSQFENFDNMYIADSYDAAKTYSYADYTNGEYGGIFYIFRPKAEGAHLTAAGLNAGDEVIFKGNLANYNGTSPQLANGVCVKRDVPDRTDEQIVADAKKEFDLTKKKYTKADTTGVDLPTEYRGATLEWAIQGGTSAYVTIEGGKLKVNSIPEEEAKVKLIVTITCGTATAQTKEIELTLAAVNPLAAGTYNILLDLTNAADRQKVYYFTGALSGNYGATSETTSAAGEVVVAAATTGTGYTFKVDNKYLEIEAYQNASGNTSAKLVLAATPTGAWAFDADLGVYTWTTGTGSSEKIWYLGTYTNNNSTFTTISASETFRISGNNAGNVGVSQFPISWVKVAEKTDEQKVAEVKAVLALTKTRFNEIGEYDLITTKNGATITWALDEENDDDIGDYVEITNNGTKLNVKSLAATAKEVGLVATITVGEAHDTKGDFVITVAAAQVLEAGTYKLSVYQGNLDQKLYFAGAISSNRGTTTLSPLEAVDVVVEKVENANEYTLKVGSEYLEVVKSGTYFNLKKVSTPTGKWQYNVSLEVLTWKFEDNSECFLGAYNQVSTIGASNITYLSGDNVANQFVAAFEKFDLATMTDADKVALSLIDVPAKLNTINAVNAEGVALPTPNEALTGVSFAWQITAGGYEGVKVEDGKFKVTALPTEADANITLTLTATCGEATDNTKTMTVTVKKPNAEAAWTEVKDASTLQANDVIIFTYGTWAMGDVSGNGKFMTAVANGFKDDELADTCVTITLEAASEGKFYLKVGDKYLAAPTSSANELHLYDKTATSGGEFEWTFSTYNEGFTLTPTTTQGAGRVLMFNANNTQERWACYTGSQKHFKVYKQNTPTQG